MRVSNICAGCPTANPRKATEMLKLALAGALALALMFPVSILAEEAAPAPVCAMTLDQVKLTLKADSSPYIVLAYDEVPKFVEMAEANGIAFAGPVSRVLIAEINGVAVFGVEINGCFSAHPMLLGFAYRPASSLSGAEFGGLIFS